MCSWGLSPSDSVSLSRGCGPPTSQEAPRRGWDTPPLADLRGCLVWCLSWRSACMCPRLARWGSAPPRTHRAEPPQPQGLCGVQRGTAWGRGQAPSHWVPHSCCPPPFLWGRLGQRPGLHTASWAPSSRARRVPALQTDLTAARGPRAGRGAPPSPRTAHARHHGPGPQGLQLPWGRQTDPLARGGPLPVSPPLPWAQDPQLTRDRDQVLPASGGDHSSSAPGWPQGRGRVGR